MEEPTTYSELLGAFWRGDAVVGIPREPYEAAVQIQAENGKSALMFRGLMIQTCLLDPRPTTPRRLIPG